jgi:hypothetical protein
MYKGGISLNVLKIVNNMYTGTTAAVKLGNQITSNLKSTRGVKQGCPLSPLLFNIYVNDLEHELKSGSFEGVYIGNRPVCSLFFADDIILMSDTLHGVQELLNRLESYCNKWQLMVNTTKTQAMIFNKGGNVYRNIKLQYGEKNVQVAQEYTYLGVADDQI